MAARTIEAYLAAAPFVEDRQAPLFRSTRQGQSSGLTPDAIYKRVAKYGRDTGIALEVNGLSPHAMRATAATNALSHQADIAMVQHWLGHSNIATTKLYDRRHMRAEDSPTLKVKY